MLGSHFGPFEITAKLGEGGMGVVYRARDTALDRDVAIKVLPQETAANPLRLERFRREAKAVAALSHPNIVTIHGIAEADGKHFLVMELIEGESLDKRIPPEGLPLSRVFDIAIPIAEALAAAHAKGVVHRDVKPANVMVTADGQVKVLDFGLAKIATEAEDGPAGAATHLPTRTAPLTGEGTVVGTAPYMSPEQLQGQPVDARGDLFSLGVVLYEMVTGHRPFQGASSIALASSILKDTPVSVTDLRSDVPRHLARIIRQCLEKSPDERFQTAKDVRNQLVTLRREIASGELPVSLEGARAPAGNRRRPILAAAAALVVLAAVATTWSVLGRHGASSAPPGLAAAPRPATAIPKLVVLPFENLGSADDEYFADGMTEELTSRLGAMEGLAVISRTSAMRYKDSRPSLAQIGEELGVDYVLEGTVRWQRSKDGPSTVRVTPQLIRVSEDTHMWTQRYDAVLDDIFDVWSDIARQVSEALGGALAAQGARPTADLAAYDAFLRGNDYFNRGIALGSDEKIELAIPMYEDAVRRDPSFALAQGRLARAHQQLYASGDHTPERLRLATAAVERALALDPNLPDAHLARGYLSMQEEHDAPRALEEFRQVLAAQPNNADAYEAISVAQQLQGQWEEALASELKAAELNPGRGEIACSTGGVYLFLRQYDEAIRQHERAIRLLPDRPCPYFCMITIHLNRDGDTKGARKVLEGLPAGIELEGNPAINHLWVLLDIFDGKYDAALERLSSGDATAYEFGGYVTPKEMLVAKIQGLLGHPELARSHYAAALEYLRKRIERSPDDARLHGTIAVALAWLGRAEEARREIGRAMELAGDERGPDLGIRLLERAEVNVALGETERAIDDLDEVLSFPNDVSAGYLRLDPTWAPLRDSPRFAAMLERNERG